MFLKKQDQNILFLGEEGQSKSLLTGLTSSPTENVSLNRKGQHKIP